MLGAVSGRVQDLIESIGQSAPLDARSRVCGFLFERLQTLESSNRVALLAPKSTIASILNLTSEAFSRVLRSLREEGIIQVAGRQIRILDPGRLSKGIGVVARRHILCRWRGVSDRLERALTQCPTPFLTWRRLRSGSLYFAGGRRRARLLALLVASSRW